ncbi:hypothetical protein LOD99_1157 [Oopsacas minuta]|uniref:Uncharacterized protein n=1 Tax=Oopsacas minuta TaxID=111878 RepID=A0AAV7K598_9METZ|nr:hypothetical protein LOD99_1157 [Oopsacas minuta]
MEQVVVNYLAREDKNIPFKKHLDMTGQFVHKVTLPDQYGITPLHHLAFQYANSKSPDLSIKIVNVIRYLINMGANVELGDSVGNTPYHIMTPGPPLFWETTTYNSSQISGRVVENFSDLKSVSVFNKYFTRPGTLYSKNNYNLSPITLYQIKNLSTGINTLTDIFPVTIRCHDIVEMRLLKEFSAKKPDMNNLFLASIKHGVPITSEQYTHHKMNQSDVQKRSLLAVTLLDSILGIRTLKEYMWLLMPQLGRFCHKIDSIAPQRILDFGVEGVKACFECLLFINTHRPINFDYLQFIKTYFKFLLQFQLHSQVKLKHIKQLVLESKDNLSNNYAFAKTPPQYPLLFIVIFITTWMEKRPDDVVDGRNILRGLESNVDHRSYGQGVAQDLTELRDELLKTLVEFDACNAALRRMLRDQHQEEGRVKQALTQQELLLSRLKETEDNFINQLRENELLNSDLRSAKNTLKSVDRQFDVNSDNIQRMEVQLNESHREIDKLREILLANERMADENMRTFRIKEDELKSKVNSSELEINSIKTTLNTTQTQCDTAQQAREKLSRDVRHKNEEVSRLNEHIIEYQNKHSQVSYWLL